MTINKRIAKRLLRKSLAALPTTVTLTHIARDDSLSDKQIAMILDGQVDQVHEEIWEWATDNDDYGVEACLEEALPDHLEREYLKASDEFSRFGEACRERDDSDDPFEDLLQNTRRKVFRCYLCRDGQDLDMEQDSWRWDDERVEAEAQKLATKAGIDFQVNREALREIVCNATYGGKLCVIWYGDVRPLYEAIEHTLKGDETGYVRITFTDPELLMYDGFNGSGHDAKVKGQIIVEFDKADVVGSRRLLCHDAMDVGHGYSWSDDIAGVHKPAYEASPKIELLQGETHAGTAVGQ